MEYKKFKNVIALKLIPDEEIFESISKVIKREKISFAKIEGIGRVKDVTIACYGNNKFNNKVFSDSYEMSSLLGNISGEESIHLHICIADDKTSLIYGGHLIKAYTHLVAEIFITIISDEKVEKHFDEKLGIPIWNLK